MFQWMANLKGLFQPATSLQCATDYPIRDGIDNYNVVDTLGNNTMNTIGRYQKKKPGRIIRLRFAAAITLDGTASPSVNGDIQHATGVTSIVFAIGDAILLQQNASGYWEPLNRGGT